MTIDPQARDVTVVVADTAEEAAARAAERLAAAARRGGAVALSGGGTPRRAYELASQLEPDWSRAEVWWGDERCVPPDDGLSNFRLARESLLERLTRPPRAVHRILGELVPDDAAAAYDAGLRATELDLAFMGIGPDGHTASLFPDAPTLDVRDRLAVAADPGLEPFVQRVTLTLPAFASVREIVFLVVGCDKQAAVEATFAKPPSRRTPASLVRSDAGTTTLIADRAAAARLDT